jgi:hypothetical protein
MGNPEPEADDLLLPTTPVDNRKAAPEGKGETAEAEGDRHPGEQTEAAEAAPDALRAVDEGTPRAPRDPIRNLVRVGWAMVTVLVVLVVLLVTGMLRISTAVDRVACIQRAQANYAATATPGASTYAINLARLGIKLALQKCG